jgi:phosphoribosylamine---glycine ligase
MKVLVVGKGGREHALLTALKESPTATELFSFPGSDAIFATVAQPAAGVNDLHTLIDFVKRAGVDLVVAGEESYLVKDEGLANLCAREGIPCWGPPREAAQLEASKEFAKKFLIRHGIPTAGYVAVGSIDEARQALRSDADAGHGPTKLPIVLKFDGLAAGKGVVVCRSPDDIDAFLDAVLVRKQFGHGRLLIEECLDGPEISIFASVVGERFHILCPARDYKRIFDGDNGPNTGGMGAVASRELISGKMLGEIERRIVAPTVAGLQQDALPYRGFLYFGLMLTRDGPKVLEYNCRFGDPECEAVMPLVGGDFARYLLDGANGRLNPERIMFNDGWSVCVVLASAGYPATSHSGDVIEGLDAVPSARVYHCGTRRHRTGSFETNGGRVLAVVATAATREAALKNANDAADRITFPGLQRRRDIGRLHFE